jgi:hypothetical protein
MEVRRRPFDPSNLPWAVSQCPFDPYGAGAKVYRAYWTGKRLAPQTTLPYIVQYNTQNHTLQWEVNYVSQHSTCILSIRFSLDNDYGTIIS